MATKIFVFGSINGQLQAAFGKLATLHSKNNFALAIVTGNLFAAEDDDGVVSALLSGTIPIPVPTYFTVGSTSLPARIVKKIKSDEEICENLHYLGKRSVTKTSVGVRIVTLGGLLDAAIVAGQSKEQHLPFHTADDAKTLRGANSTDILLTTIWPKSVWNGSRVELPLDSGTIPSSDAVADLCAALKPKYHFAMSSTDSFYEREAFFHPSKEEGDTSFDVTRFIALASFSNSAKAKSMYAFSLQKEAVTSLPLGATVSPFYKQVPPKKRSAADVSGYSRFSNAHHGDHGRNKRRRERSPPPGPDRCFFCLSNPNLPSHMVSNIGEESYLATAKGPLPSSKTFAKEGLDFPGHMIAVPFSHSPTLTSSGMGQEDAAKAFREMSRFRESLQAMISSRTKRKLGSVTWEINRKQGIHAHWQFMPVPSDMVQKGLVEAAFKVEAENQNLPKLESRYFGIGDEVEGDYFRVWIFAEEDDDGDDGGRIISKSLLMRLDERERFDEKVQSDKKVRFDLQFGRKVMAKLLGLESRMVWQDCVQSEDEEKQDVAAFRKAFEEWDFTK